MQRLSEALHDALQSFCDGDSEEPLWGIRSAAEVICESPIEMILASQLSKHLRGNVELLGQVKVDTRWGQFRLDLMVTLPSSPHLRIAFECDGRDYHDPHRDQWRDALVIGSGVVDGVYRIRGHDLTFHPDDVMLVISRLNPQLFTERSRHIIEREACELAVEQVQARGQARVVIHYPERPDLISTDPFEGSEDWVFVERRGRRSMGLQKDRPLLEPLYRFALTHQGLNVDELVEAFELEHGPHRDPWLTNYRLTRGRRGPRK